MSAYVTKSQGYLFDGESYITAAAIDNGSLVTITSGKVAVPSGTLGATFRVVSKEGPYGKRGLTMQVVKQGDDDCMILDNIPTGLIADYDETAYKVPKDAKARVHRLLAGEEVCIEAGATLLASLEVGDGVKFSSAGALEKIT